MPRTFEPISNGAAMIAHKENCEKMHPQRSEATTK
jgi:hypothetical protein